MASWYCTQVVIEASRSNNNAHYHFITRVYRPWNPGVIIFGRQPHRGVQMTPTLNSSYFFLTTERISWKFYYENSSNHRRKFSLWKINDRGKKKWTFFQLHPGGIFIWIKTCDIRKGQNVVIATLMEACQESVHSCEVLVIMVRMWWWWSSPSSRTRI